MEMSMSDEQEFHCSHDYRTFWDPEAKADTPHLGGFMISNSGLKEFIDHVESHNNLRVRGIVVHDDGTVELAAESLSDEQPKFIPTVSRL